MAEQSDIQSLIQLLGDRMDRQDTRLDRQEAQQQTTNNLLLRSLNQQEAPFSLRQNFQKHQEGTNDRQDQFNIIFLDEIRGMKKEYQEVD